MTQKIKLLNMLRKKEWVCTTDFQSNFIPEFRSLIAHMRKHESYQIIDEPCMGKCGKKHDSRGLKRWKLASEPYQAPEGKDFCRACGHFMDHSINCPTQQQKSVAKETLF